MSNFEDSIKTFIQSEEKIQDVSARANEVLYEYDNTAFVMDDSQLGNTEIGDYFYTADGTKAIVVDTQYYIPADTQAIVLQNGEDDLNSYIVDNECDSIILGDDSDLATSALAETEVVQLVDVDQDKNQEIIYYTSDSITPDQLQKAFAAFDTKIDTDDNSQTDNNTYMLKQKLKIQQVVDLEDLIRQQNGDDTFLIQDSYNSEGESQYQYAILKDGKLHIQTYDNSSDIILPSASIDDQSEVKISNIVSQETEMIDLSNLDLNKVTGRNLMTGQTVTLHEYLSKLNKRISSPTNIFATESKPKKKTITKSLNHQNIKSHKKQPLNTLLNKKIHIGKTYNGKNLIGKIVHVESNLSTSQVEESIKIEPNLVSLMAMDESNDGIVENVISNSTTFEDMHNFSVSLREAYVGEVQILPGDVEIENNCLERFQTKLINIDNEIQDSGFSESLTDDTQISVCKFESSDSEIVDNEAQKQEETKNNVILLVKSHTISKDCYNDICKMLHGLMYMDTVKNKLVNKNLAVKVVLKKFDQEQNDFTKNILHIYGYMKNDNESKEPDAQPKWRFVPDKNTQDALLAGGIELDALPLEIIINEESGKTGKTCKYPKTVVLNLLINYDKLGKKTVKVQFNPTSSNKCTVCRKTFGSLHEVQTHLLKSHKVEQTNGLKKCNICLKIFCDAKSLKRHKETHSGNKTVIYKCNLCKQTFVEQFKYLEHISNHEPVTVVCAYCCKSFPNDMELEKHMSVHSHKRMFECTVCHRRFTRQSNLMRHVEIHTKNGGSPFTCDICGASYCYNSSLTRHMVQNHIVKFN